MSPYLRTKGIIVENIYLFAYHLGIIFSFCIMLHLGHVRSKQYTTRAPWRKKKKKVRLKREKTNSNYMACWTPTESVWFLVSVWTHSKSCRSVLSHNQSSTHQPTVTFTHTWGRTSLGHEGWTNWNVIHIFFRYLFFIIIIVCIPFLGYNLIIVESFWDKQILYCVWAMEQRLFIDLLLNIALPQSLVCFRADWGKQRKRRRKGQQELKHNP